jgi:hypothetical protein
MRIIGHPTSAPDSSRAWLAIGHGRHCPHVDCRRTFRDSASMRYHFNTTHAQPGEATASLASFAILAAAFDRDKLCSHISLSDLLSFKMCPVTTCSCAGTVFTTELRLMRHMMTVHFDGDTVNVSRTDFVAQVSKHQRLLRNPVEFVLSCAAKLTEPDVTYTFDQKPIAMRSDDYTSVWLRVATLFVGVVKGSPVLIVRYSRTQGNVDVLHCANDELSRRIHQNGEVCSLDRVRLLDPATADVESMSECRRFAPPDQSLDKVVACHDLQTVVCTLIVSLRRCLTGLKRVKTLDESLGGVQPWEIVRKHSASTEWFIQWTPRACRDITAEPLQLDVCFQPWARDADVTADVDMHSVALSHLYALEQRTRVKAERATQLGQPMTSRRFESAILQLASLDSAQPLLDALVMLVKPSASAATTIENALKCLGSPMNASAALPNGERLDATVWDADTIRGAQLQFADAFARKFNVTAVAGTMQLYANGKALDSTSMVTAVRDQLAAGQCELRANRNDYSADTNRHFQRADIDRRMIATPLGRPSPSEFTVSYSIGSAFPRSAYELRCRVLHAFPHVRNPLLVLIRYQGRVVDDTELNNLECAQATAVDITFRAAYLHRVPRDRITPTGTTPRVGSLAPHVVAIGDAKMPVLVESNVPGNVADVAFALVEERLRPYPTIIQPAMLVSGDTETSPVSVACVPAVTPFAFNSGTASRGDLTRHMIRCVIDVLLAVAHLHDCHLAHGSLDSSTVVALNGQEPTWFIILSIRSVAPLTEVSRVADHRALGAVISKFVSTTVGTASPDPEATDALREVNKALAGSTETAAAPLKALAQQLRIWGNGAERTAPRLREVGAALTIAASSTQAVPGDDLD